MAIMKEPCPQHYTGQEFSEAAALLDSGLTAFFIYSGNVYSGGKIHPIDPDNFRVKVEMRSGVPYAPAAAFAFCTGAVDAAGQHRHAPFVRHGHTYLPIVETAEAMGLTTASFYQNRMTVIGGRAELDRLTAAIRKNPALEDAAAAVVIGTYAADRFTHEDFCAAKDSWRAYLVGTPETIDTADPTVQQKLRTISDSARHLMQTMNRGADAVILWGQTAPQESWQLTEQYGKIAALSTAWGTFGGELYHNDDLKNDILYALQWMNETMYGEAEIEGRGWRSINDFNWWDWYVGAPEHLLDALFIMEPCLSEEQIRTYLRPFKYLLDHWRLTYSQNECSGRMSVGTKCAVLLEDAERLAISANDYHVMLDITLEGPGTHTDFCNYQHGFPYNMVYGLSNLHRVLKVGSILAETPLAFQSPRYYNLFLIFRYMFEAAVFRGRTFVSFRGRSSAGSEYDVCVEIVIHILRMLGNYGPEEDDAIRRFVKACTAVPEILERTKQSCPISSVAALMQIINDDTLPTQDRREYAHAWFSADRAVQHRADYAFLISMPSCRHTSYECINHENQTGWYMNDGTLYLYTETDPHEFDGVNFVKNDRLAHKMPGTTVDDRPRPAVSISEGWIPPNDLVGCMQFADKYIVAGMDYTCYNREVGEDDYIDTGYGGGKPRFPNDLTARKAYFMFDRECVCIGTGIRSTMNADVHTVVEHRRLVKNETPESITVNGTELPQGVFEERFAHPSHACVEGFAGFVFADAPTVSVSRYLYTPDGTPNGTDKGRPYVEILIKHGKNPENASYAYAVLPYADERTLAAYAAHPEFEILSNTTACQAVRKPALGITGIVFYEAGECAGIRVDRPCLVTFSDTDSEIRIKVCEPTNKADTVRIRIAEPCTPVSAHPRYTVSYDGATTLTLDVSRSAGEAYEAVLKKNKNKEISS